MDIDITPGATSQTTDQPKGPAIIISSDEEEKPQPRKQKAKAHIRTPNRPIGRSIDPSTLPRPLCEAVTEDIRRTLREQQIKRRRYRYVRLEGQRVDYLINRSAGFRILRVIREVM